MAVAAHLQKARAFLQDAQLCVDHGRYDSAVSRAYYAMFRVAIALLEHYDDGVLVGIMADLSRLYGLGWCEKVGSCRMGMSEN